MLAENNSTQTQNFIVTTKLMPDGQTTHFPGETSVARRELIEGGEKFNVTHRYEIHWQGNWVLVVNVIGEHPNTGEIISNTTGYYWLYAHSNTEQFTKDLANNTATSASVAIQSVELTRNSLIVTSVILSASVAVTFRGLIGAASERRLTVRPWIGRDPRQIANHGFFDSGGRLEGADLNPVWDGSRSPDGIAFRCTIWFRNYGSLPAENVQIRETELSAHDVPDISVLDNVEYERPSVVMPSEVITYDFAIRMSTILQQATDRVFQLFQIRYGYGQRIAFYELIIEYVNGQFVPRVNRVRDARRWW